MLRSIRRTQGGTLHRPLSSPITVSHLWTMLAFLPCFHYSDREEDNCVKGKLKSHSEEWEKNGANKLLLILYLKRLQTTVCIHTESRIVKINKSAILNSELVSNTIKDLVQSGSITKMFQKPEMISPLSVATDSSGKKRLIIDLRYVNENLYKDFVSFDDWREFQDFSDGFIYKFDLRKGY